MNLFHGMFEDFLNNPAETPSYDQDVLGRGAEQQRIMDQLLHKTDIRDRDIAQGDPVGEESKLLFPSNHGYIPEGRPAGV
jgi:hypothetical protein